MIHSRGLSVTDNLNIDRSVHTATLLANGKVLIAGGMRTSTPGNGTNINSCEIYNPVSGIFSLAQNMSLPRASHAATLLTDGSVLISGGAWNNRNCERYDFTSNTWSQTGDMTVTRRSSHTATLLHNGKVLLAGGYTDAISSSAELFDPLTNSFTAVDNMFTSREQHASTILPDGNVLVTGGYSTDNPVNLAELYIADTSSTVGIDNQISAQQTGPESFHLLQNYPNPFNSITTIKFILPQAEFVNLTIYDHRGTKIKTLLNEKRSIGLHKINFDAKDVPGGLYFYKIVAGTFVSTKKLVLIK